MGEHTPGPWRLAKEPPAVGLTVTFYGFGPKTLGVIHTGNEEYMANARLIVAAPGMLYALRDAERRLRGAGMLSADDPVCLAIAAATGARLNHERR